MGNGIKPELAVGIGVLVFAAIVGHQASVIPTSVYARVGPEVIPYAVAAGLAALGATLVWQALSGAWTTDDPEISLPIDWGSLRWLLAGLAVNVAAIDWAGFILASTVLFALTSRCFGSETPVKDAALGFALATVSFVGFSKGLGINIGAGLIEGLF